jgi:TonB family protein
MFDRFDRARRPGISGPGMTALGVHALVLAGSLRGAVALPPREPHRIFPTMVPFEPMRQAGHGTGGSRGSPVHVPVAPTIPGENRVIIPAPLPESDFPMRPMDPRSVLPRVDGAGSWLRVGSDSEIVSSADLAEPPELRAPVTPMYPAMLAASGVGARVRVRYVVDTLGDVEQPSITFLGTAGPTGPAFEASVRDALDRMRFRPGRRSGRTVRVLVEQTFVFRAGGE